MNRSVNITKDDSVCCGWLSITRLRKRRMLWDKSLSFRQYYGQLLQDSKILLLYQDDTRNTLLDSIDLAQYELTTGSHFYRKSQRSFHLSTENERIVVVAESKHALTEWVTAIQTLPSSPPCSVIDKWLERFEVQPTFDSLTVVDVPISPKSPKSPTSSISQDRQALFTTKIDGTQSLSGRMQSLLVGRRKSSPALSNSRMPSPPQSPLPPLPQYRNILEPRGYNGI